MVYHSYRLKLHNASDARANCSQLFRVRVVKILRLMNKKALSPSNRGEGHLQSTVFYLSSSSSSVTGAARLNSLAGRTVFSPGKGRVNPVASYQVRWLAVSTSSESGL